MLLCRGHDAAVGRVRRRVERQLLVDINADADQAMRAGGLENAVAGLAGNLEDDVRMIRLR